MLQELSVLMYSEPLVRVKNAADFPNLDNPLHLAILLLDADIEIDMSGMDGFISGKSGQNILLVTKALQIIGSNEWPPILEEIQALIRKHRLTWEQLKSDSTPPPPSLTGFTNDLKTLAPAYSLFNSEPDTEDTYALLCDYIEARLPAFNQELHRWKG